MIECFITERTEKTEMILSTGTTDLADLHGFFFNKNRKNSFRCLWLLRNLVLSDMSLSFRASSYA